MTKQISKKGRRLFALLLAVAMMFTAMPMSAIAVTANSDGYIEVSTIEDLYNIRNDLTANYILMNDIDLSDATAAGGDWDYEGRGWNPIGSGDAYSNNAFTGTFDGNGYSITGMRISVTTLPSGAGSKIYLGLFANVTGTIKNLTIDGNVYANWTSSAVDIYAGAVAGYCTGTIGNCDTNADMSVASTCYTGKSTYVYAGGLVGFASGATITGCVNNGEINAIVGASYSSSYKDNAYAAGIVGYSDSNNTKISNSYNTGEIIANGAASSYSTDAGRHYAAGIANVSATIQKCYNAAPVTAKYTGSGSYREGYAYGIGGSIVRESYNIGAVKATTSQYAVAIGTLTNCYYLTGVGSSSTGATALTEAQMMLSSVYVGFDFQETWLQKNTAEYPYPQFKNKPQDIRVIENVILSSVPAKTEYAYGERLDLTGAKITVKIKDGDDQIIPVTADMVTGYAAETPGTQTLTVTYKGRTVTFEVVVKEKVYTPIYTVEDLYNIRKDLTGSYILMNDIDLTDATAAGGAWDFNGNGWNPIGSGDIYGNGAFAGELDGNDHKIIGMRIDVKAYPSGIGKDVYYGLFANVTGYIHDLSFVGGSISSTINTTSVNKYVGALAGKIDDATIHNVHNEMNKMSITSGQGCTNYCGGIVGYSSKSTISQSSNCVDIYSYTKYYSSSTCYTYAGGINGYLSSGTISECYNTGDVTSEGTRSSTSSSSYDSNPYAAGISGYNSNGLVTKSYNAGDIEASGGYSNYGRGICAYGTVSQCYNVGKVTGGSGYAIGGTTTNDAYYLAGTGASITGSTSLTEAQMLLSSMYEGFDFASTWVQDADAVYPYPQLSNIPQDMRVIEGMELISLPSKTVYAYGEEFKVDGCKINLKIANGDEQVLVTEDMVTGYNAIKPGTQTLTITYMGNTLTFTVVVNEKVYVPIYTIEELYNVRNNLGGSYILMADIDLSSATARGGDWDFMGNGWNPIGSNDTYSNYAFSGEFDGNGHKITGLRIDVTSVPSGTSTVYLGLFAKVTGTVKDLTVTGDIKYTCNKDFYIGSIAAQCSGRIESCINNADISGVATALDVDGYVGSIVGIANAKSVIFNCANTGDIISNCHNLTNNTLCDYDINSAGGIAGEGETSAVISQCYNTGDVSAKAMAYSSSYYGKSYAAGIAKVGKISESYNTGKVSAEEYNTNVYSYAYGIGGTASNCYNVGMVSGGNYHYGIAATESNNCYYLDGIGTTSTGATALTETQMRLQTMFAGFDFNNTWTLNEFANHPYPQLRNNIQDLDESASLVSIISWPLKTEYMTGDDLILDGCMIDVTYVSGHKELLSVTADMISGFDNSVTGEQIITVTYRGSSDTFPVTVTARPEVTGIELISQPDETEFRIGTEFDFTGAKIKVSYAGGKTEEMDVTVDMTTGGNIHHLGKQTITVTYYGKTTTFEVKVIPVAISSLKLETMPTKTEYLEGQELDLSGMVLVAVMNNKTENQVSVGYTVSGYSSEPGKHTVTIGYMGKTVSFEVKVKAKSVVSLVLKAAPNKTEYVAGQAFNPTGMMIVATYDNGDVEVIENYVLNGFDDVPGLKTVVASYGDKYVAFPVSIIARVITDFNITSYPAKTEYLQYDVFDSTGLKVEATYNDGTTEEITNYELVGYSSNPGTHTVSVAYEGWVKTFTVNVSPRVLTNLIVVAPTKLTYFLSEEFDPTGLTVTACYNNGQQVVIEDYSITGFDSNTPGTKTITIGYGGLTSEFSVSVSARSEIVTEGSFTVGNLIGRLGETVVIPVSVNKNTGVAGFAHTITFDASDLRFVSAAGEGVYANGTIVVNEDKASEGEITVLWFGAADVVNNGDVYNLTFEVLETATDGISDITISFDENDNGNISGENVLFGTVNGYVDIRSYWLGDLDGDRKYAMVDLLQLAQYVSGKEMTLTDKQKLSADVNEDGNIDIHDVIMLNQWLLVADM